MPATAGRVRMPANNRVHSSAALQTHGIWQSAIGYDPYAPANKDSAKESALPGEDGSAAENAYASFQGLLALARVTGSGSNEARGSCRKCGRVGHLTFQCRNFLSAKDSAVFDKDKDADAIQAAAHTAFEQIKKSSGLEPESSEEEEEESDSSDSDIDPDIEKIIAARFSKKSRKRMEDNSEEKKRSQWWQRRSKKRSDNKNSGGGNDPDSEEEDEKREKRRRHRRSDDDGEEKPRHKHSRKSRKDKKTRRHRKDDSDDESEEKSDRHHRHHHKWKNSQRNDSESDSDEHEQTRKKRAYSENGSESNGSDDLHLRKGKKSSKHRCRSHQRKKRN
ncbi:CAX-interacting protein 4-like [Musa acuminata AAA Group]|uniref:CAX-interacting protein 4-like n=1 Tax=Musa acuminata AAA Group TaxID=214697 RepID=UPI0031D4CEFF